jgi:1,4-dihydroxy-2-naphthoyl-CoA synthase
LAEAYAVAGEAMAQASQTDAAREGMAAFLEKRKASFGDR